MKNLLLPFLFLSLFVISCGDDDAAECETTDVRAIIVGNWEEKPLQGIGDEVTFSSDFTGSCTEASLFATEVNGTVSTTFTWTVSADNSEITLSYPNSLGVTYNISSVDCDEIDLELFGFTINLTRK